ncbi:MAG: hypothetical protein QF724_09705, partial [Planctomycetota bacterium]|nr:hypothetical protein [Planctomycetota bacterium]
WEAVDLEPKAGGPLDKGQASGRGAAPAAVLDELAALRRSLAARRAATPARSEVHLHLDSGDLLELGSLGYTGQQAPPGATPGDGKRLCLDGCVWPRE